MNAPRTTWADLATPWVTDPRRFRMLWWLAPAAVAALALVAPVQTAVLTAFVLLWALLWLRPSSIILLLVALMGNVKINYYAGFFTVFPEYVPVAIAALVWALRWAEGGRRVEEPRIMLLYAALVLAGAFSYINAVALHRVFAKTVLIGVALVTFYLAFTAVRTKADLGRALSWLEGAAFVVAAYGIWQMVGSLMGFDTSLSFLERYSNPDMYLGIGAPVYLRLSKFYRANSFFNDPNILGGFLAAAFSVTLALRLHHRSDPARRRRARFEDLALIVMAACQLLTLSRSGFLATLVGVCIVLAFLPSVLRSARFWIGIVAGLGVIATLSYAVGIDPVLLFLRLGQSFDTGDLSSRIHRDVFFYGLSLLARYPITGVGLGNFGAHYGSEMDTFSPNMNSHNAVINYFAESGLLGGLLFLSLVFAIARRPWRALRDPRFRRAAPELHAWTVGLFAALISLYVANIFYDYYLRTFVCVFSALALAAARLWERERWASVTAAGA